MENRRNSIRSQTGSLPLKTRFFSLLTSARVAYTLLFLFIVAYTLFYTWMSWHLHATFITSADDLSNVDQVVWNSQHGRLLERTTGTRSLPRYGEHVEPIWIALGLLYFGWDDVRVLLLTQTITLALGALPVFWWARDAWQRENPAYGAGLLFALVYLLNPFVARATLAEVHATPFAVTPMLLALYWGWQGKWGRVAPLVLLVLLVREDMGLLIIGFGGWMAGRWLIARMLKAASEKPNAENDNLPPGTLKQGGKPSLRSGVVLIASGVAGIAIMMFGIIRTFADERFSGQDNSIFFERYAAFGDSPLAIIGGMLTRWDLWAELFSDPYRLNFLRDFILGTGGLGLFAPVAWLLFAPHFILNLLSDYFGQYGSLQHYGAPLVPGMMVAAILGGAALLRWGRYHPAWRLTLLLAALLGALFTARTATGQALARDWITPTETAHHRLLPFLIQQIPPDAPLSADPQLHPHVAHRHDAYRFPTVGDNAEWILVDVTTNTTRHPVDLKQDIETLLAGEWGVADGQDGYLLLQKGNPSKTIPDEFYTFAHASTPPDIRMHLALDGAVIHGYSLRQDFWGRVSVEWQLSAVSSESGNFRPDAALFTPDGTPITDTIAQPIPALVWRPVETWQAGEPYLLRTLPRHPTSPFYPALTVRREDNTPLSELVVSDDGDRFPVGTSSVLRRQQDGWWLGGEWYLRDNQATRGITGWRLFDPPVPLNRNRAAWDFVELRAWEIVETEDALQITLTWHALADSGRNVQRFIHLVPAEGVPLPLSQTDSPLGGNDYSGQWQEGEWVVETITLPRPPDDSAWRLLVGLYDPATGVRFSVTPDAGDNTFEVK